MKSKYMFIVNLCLTCLTVIVVCVTCGGCKTAELETAQTVLQSVKPGLEGAGPAMVTQPWYVFVLLAADIASSIIAAIIAFKKKTENQ